MKSAALITWLVAAGHLPLLAAESGNGSNIDAATGPAAVKPIRGHLSGFTPGVDGLASRESYTLTYDIVHWIGVAARTGKTNNSVVGTVSVTRRKRSSDVQYKVSQRTNFGGMENIMEAQIVCADNALNTLRSWQIRTSSRDPSKRIVPLSEMNEMGENADGKILIKDGEYNHSFIPANPVISQWTILDFLMRHATKTTSVTFDLLQDLSLFKKDQTLVFDGTVEIAVEDNQQVKLDTYAQTGEGILPIHYLLDEKNLPQLITTSIVSWTLKDVS